MSKHKPVFIQVSDLSNRVFGDSDDFTLEDALEIEDGEALPDQHLWVYVTWPEHVSTPRFNSDANYTPSFTRDEAVAYDPDAGFYGE